MNKINFFTFSSRAPIKAFKWALAPLLVLAGFAATATATTAPVPLDISQIPSIYAQRGIAPNLFLLLDNSGSMQFEYLGTASSDISSGTYGLPYGYPLGSSRPYCSSCGSYPQDIPGFAADNRYAAQYRAAHVNPNYYNPAITYTPWACAAAYPESSDETGATSPISGFSCHWDSGTSLWVMDNANPAQSYLNPSRTSAGFRDVEVWNDSTDGNNNTADNGYAGESSCSRFGCYGGDPTWYTGISCGRRGCSPQTTEGNLPFWPATYFNYFGPMPGADTDYQDTSNYEQVQICPVTATTNSNGVSSTGNCTLPPVLPSSPLPYHTYVDGSGNYVYIESDGTQISRTPADEMQNFANWYQYDRSHILEADAGIGLAFMQLPTSFRVDYGVINTMDGNKNGAEIKNTEDFTQDTSTGKRYAFLNTLYNEPIPQDSTPNREALDNVGNWFSENPQAGQAPWGNSAAETAAGSSTPLSCRANYVIFATDGTWNGGSPGVGNQDGSDGPTLTDGNGNSYQYTPTPPYQDSYSDTLADVAMKFWKNDIQTGMSNDVPPNSQDNAFWQHMVSFTVGLGVTPTLVTAYQANHPGVTVDAAQQAVYQELVDGTQSWPDVSSGADTTIDDTWHAAVDGHGTFASASDPTELYTAIANALVNIVNRTGAASSLAVNTEKAGQTRTSQQVFQALFHPQNWWGDVVALPVFATPATTTSPGGLTLSAKATWSASCVLTGGSCPQMGPPTPTVSVEAPASRDIASWNGTAGVNFTATTLASSALSQIGGADVVNYIRGVRSEETGNGGTLRARTSVMGDVVDSSPTFVGAPDAQYSDTWSNVLYPTVSGLNPENGGTAYSAFKSSNVDRENMVYVGGNGGMLHGFEAGTTTDTSTNDGKEVLAYVPEAVYPNLKQYASGVYQHHYYVDGTPDAGDVYYGGGWHTWLVGGEGAGGQSIFALNISDPLSFSPSDVIGEWGPGNITCVNVANCGNDLGNSFGTPVITRFNNGQWGFVFGNGLNSASGTASIFVGLIGSGGIVTFYELKTGYGPGNDPTGANRPDGIAYVTPVDLNGDHTADYVYAGDYFGNVWRFNLTSYSDPANWNANYGGSGSPMPMFTATNANDTAQPITTKPVVAAVPAANGYSRVMVEFGTGAAITNAQQAPNTSAAGVQSLYGIWDWDFSAWNAGHPSGDPASTPAAYQYDALTTNPGTLTRADLTAQTITTEQTSTTVQGGSVNNRVVSDTAVCWQGEPASTACTLGDNTHYGWLLDLVYNGNRQGEKVIYNPVLRSGVLIATTNIPTTASGLTCQALGTSGWTMALDPANGGRLQFEPFDTQGNGQFDQITVNGQLVNTSGIALGAVGSPSFLTYGNETYLVTNTSGGTATLAKINLGSGQVGVQLSWQELR